MRRVPLLLVSAALVCLLALPAAAQSPEVVPIAGTMMISACCPPGSWYLLSGDSAHLAPAPPEVYAGSPDLTQDGQRIAYVSGGVLHTGRADGSDEAALTATQGVVNCSVRGVRWSPDGTRIAFSMPADDSPTPPGACNGGEVWVINADGTGLHQISHQSNITIVSGWSPDGRSVIWQTKPCGLSDGVCAIWVGSTEGGDAHPISGPDHPLYTAYTAAWSPDGERLAMTWDIWEADGSVTEVLGTVAPDGTDPEVVFQTTRPAEDAGASWQSFSILGRVAWSPDGAQLAFSSAMHTLPAPGTRSDIEVYIVNADGTGLTRVTYDGADNAVWWISGPNTQPGSAVTVTTGGVSVTFDTVTGPGVTTAVVPEAEIPPDLPAPYSAVGPAYDIETTATYSGSVTITLPCHDPSAFNGDNVVMLRYDPAAGTWQDITTARDAASGLVSGRTEALGLFRLAVTPAVVPIPGTMMISACCPGPPPGSRRLFSGDSAHSTAVPSWIGDHYALGLSPDGQRFAYVTGGVLYTCGVDGSGEVALPVDDAVGCGVCWSPDGTRIAFSRPAPDSPIPAGACRGGEVWVINADGTGLHQLSHQSNTTTVWGWSPDGRYVVWQTQGACPTGGACAVWVGSAEGGDAHPITGSDHPLWMAWAAGWSPDGRRIALAWTTWADDGSVTAVLGTVAPDGSDPQPVFQSTRPAGDAEAFWQNINVIANGAAWSPDGAQLAFTTAMHTLPAPGTYGDNEAYLINADGTGLMRVTYDGADNAVWWVGPNTQPGSAVSITIGDTTIIFANVAMPGLTTAAFTEAPPGPAPSGFQLLGDYYDIRTTATVSGTITIQIRYEEAEAPGGLENQLRLLRYNSSLYRWEDITTSVDPASNVITGHCTGLSTFGIAVAPKFVGFLAPIEDDGSSVFKLNSTVPVKFQLIGPDGAPVTDADCRLYREWVSSAITGTEQEPTFEMAPDSGNAFRYSDDHYQHNLSTKGLQTGTWALWVTLDGVVLHESRISLR